MSTALFLKKNKKVRENVKYIATRSLCDEDGNPLEWELKHVSTRENTTLQEECTTMVPTPGKPNHFTPKLNTTRYITRLVAASVVYPDLYDTALQDSYGVNKPEDLIQEMVDDSGEWNALMEFVTKLNGFVPLQEDVDTAKN